MSDMKQATKKGFFEGSPHYTTPDGYFNTLTDRIMAAVGQDQGKKDDRVEPSPHVMLARKRNIRDLLRPYLYLAASFMIIMVGFRLTFQQRQQLQNQATHTVNQVSVANNIYANQINDYEPIYTDYQYDQAEEYWLEATYME